MKRAAPDNALLLTVDQAAAMIGVSKDTVYRLILDINPETGLPNLFSTKIGRLRKIPAFRIDEWMHAGCPVAGMKKRVRKGRK